MMGEEGPQATAGILVMENSIRLAMRGKDVVDFIGCVV